jgi:predicted small lipoprotein YifL
VRRSILLVLSFALAFSATGCGSEEGERGLTPPASDEVAAPESERELRKTEQQREQENEQQEEQVEAEEFDAAEGG